MASPAEPEVPANTLGLDFEQKGAAPASPATPATDTTTGEKKDDGAEREKKKPYVNPERVKTGGAQRDKMTEEELSERMARMREQNEKIKQRRLDVQADEEAFKKTQETERARLASIRKVQEGVDRTREQNAKRKLDKMQNREWDSGKSTGGAEWKQRTNKAENKKDEAAAETPKKEKALDAAADDAASKESPKAGSASTNDSGNWVRGGGPRGSPRGRGGRGQGRGRGRGGASPAASADAAPKEDSSKQPEPTAV
ncbi:hypothetical protein HMN09_00053300 [Mycena chlorophos]|uniref:Uncharacterized protein n=1 Tax=Mycena chlorophos TaxID=658473 RepID=A0A8H6TTF1_MYCCL|nr:hypothetical protein HMN09_00053300 [Mycena chlorophos]